MVKKGNEAFKPVGRLAWIKIQWAEIEAECQGFVGQVFYLGDGSEVCVYASMLVSAVQEKGAAFKPRAAQIRVLTLALVVLSIAGKAEVSQQVVGPGLRTRCFHKRARQAEQQYRQATPPQTSEI
jgi:hypothetical protein